MIRKLGDYSLVWNAGFKIIIFDMRFCYDLKLINIF